MSWTGEAVAKRVEKLNLVVTVRFNDGVGSSFEEDVPAADLTDGTLSSYISRRCAELDKIDAAPVDLAAALAALTLGPIAKVPVAPTQEMIDRNAYFVLRSRLRALRVAVTEGHLPDTDPEYVAAEADNKKKWRPEYLDDVRWGA